jgi:hypothetical protein
VPVTGKSLKRPHDEREASEPPEETAKPDGEEEEDEEEEDEDEEAASKRLRTSKTGKRGPAGRVPLKTKADPASGGTTAGKQAAATAREPVSIVRKADGDAIVDDLGNVLDKLPQTEGDGEADAEPMDVDGTDTPRSPSVKGDEDVAPDVLDAVDDSKLVDDLTHGVTIDMDDAEGLVQSLGADGLDGINDWADIEFVSPFTEYRTDVNLCAGETPTQTCHGRIREGLYQASCRLVLGTLSGKLDRPYRIEKPIPEATAQDAAGIHHPARARRQALFNGDRETRMARCRWDLLPAVRE